MQVLNPSATKWQLSTLLKKIPGIRSSAKQVSPAARLPTQILVRILQEVCKTWTWKYLERRGWTVLAHVCRSWRAAAFDIPRLWADYRFSLEEERHIGHAPFGYSAMLAMDVDAKWTAIHWERLVRLIFGNCDRIESLALTGARVCSVMQQNANRPAPELWQITLDSDHAKHKKFRIWRSKKSPFVLPPGIFDGQLPALSHLSLTDIVVDLNSPVLSKTLAYLALSRTNEGSPRLCSLPQFLEVLSTMKLLRHLTVEDILTEPEDEALLKQSLEQLPQVYLLQLETLHLRIPSMQNYSGFLDKVQFHVGSTCCYLDTTVSVPRIQGFQMLPRGLYIDPPAETHFTKLQVCIQASRELSFCASGEAGSLTFKVVDCAAFAGLLSICFHLRKPLSTVRSLKLDSSTSIGGQSSPFAEYLPGVTDLSIESWDQKGLLASLSRPNTFPKLARLEFNDGPGYAMQDPAEFFTMLADAIGKRLQAGLSLELAVMHRAVPCRTSEDLENIRQRSGLYTIKGLNEALATYKQPISCTV
ncbi:hypothetical protein EWM64_g4816 [Hericium alpestre]|uniref:F-box domain-containing protein n=1 Tax=Hericium alpestre TaxID=135208 RepID=A0A4Z0A073_9AGAM|nr:hypothetical protein EWM64_g4816 [Hericium alpestre]